MGNEIAPVLAAGIVDGRFHDLVVLGAIAVGQDDEAAFVVIRLIIVVRLAGRDKLRAFLRRGQIEEADLARLVIARANEKIAPILALSHAREEACIGLLIDQLILIGLMANSVQQHLQRPAMLVDAGVIEAAPVGIPDGLSFHIGNFVRQFLARLKMADFDPVELGALVVEGIGQKAVIAAPGRGPERKIGLARGERVAVEQNLRFAARTRLTAQARVLTARDVAHEIGVSAIRRRDCRVILLDAPLHLLEESVLERLGIGHDLFRVGIFRLKISPHICAERLRVAHDFLPVHDAQPGIIVDALNAVMDVLDGVFLGYGRIGWKGVRFHGPASLSEF